MILDTEFLVARNPDTESTLPYLLFIPIEGGTWLKAKETWPRAARVYCHPCEAPDIASLEILERVRVIACERRGPAIDLVLARGTNKRSQFVFTHFKGRAMIFWQTPKSAAASRPGLRVPVARTPQDTTFVVDTRERYGYSFRAHHADVVRRALRVGDYAIERDGRIIAIVERKTIDDAAGSLVDGTLNFVMAELSTMAHAAVVIEGRYAALFRHEYSRPGFLVDVLARLQVRYPSVPLVFTETRKLGEEWTFRFFREAAAAQAAVALSALPQPPGGEPSAGASRRKRGRRTGAATREPEPGTVQ